MPRLDHFKAKRDEEMTEEIVRDIRLTAAKRMRADLDNETPWKDRTIATVNAMEAIRGFVAEKRARINADAIPRQLTVVTVVPQIADPQQWEAEMAQINAGKPPVLEIQAIPAADEPAKEG